MLFIFQLSSCTISGSRVRFEAAKESLIALKESINNRVEMSIGSTTVLSDLTNVLYGLSNKTAKFCVGDNCIGCGLCAKNCPQGVIEMKDNKPRWIKPDCTKCSACICRCPKQAIQYGNATKKRNRYVNPEEND